MTDWYKIKRWLIRVNEDYNDMQWPCPAWFHVPLSSEWTAMKTADYYIASWWYPQVDFHIPQADYIQSNGTRNTQNYWFYWMSDWNTTYSRPNNFTMRDQKISTQYSSMWCSIRPFKDTFVEPESSWTVVRGTFWWNWIFWNQTDEIISIVYNDTRITIADKNLWATEVYVSGATKTEANCGKYYQRWNNNWFARESPTKYITYQMSWEWYWPGNYYNSDYFIIYSKNRDSSNNSNLRWWETQWSWTRFVEKQIYP